MMRKMTIAIALTAAWGLFGPAGSALAAGAQVTGTVKLDGKAPAAKLLTITKDQHVCGDGQRAVDEVKVSDGGLLADVVVFVEGKIDGITAPAVPEGGYQLIQEGCRFNPDVSFVPRKSKLKIINQDPLAHNIHAYEMIGRARRDLLNFAQPVKGHTKVETIAPRRGNIVQLNCDIHDFMKGWIFVPDNPFAANVTDGRFSIDGIPAGKRTLKAFHPVFGFVEQDVELEDGKTATVDFVFKGK